MKIGVDSCQGKPRMEARKKKGGSFGGAFGEDRVHWTRCCWDGEFPGGG